jgi:hypothetical protein
MKLYDLQTPKTYMNMFVRNCEDVKMRRCEDVRVLVARDRQGML